MVIISKKGKQLNIEHIYRIKRDYIKKFGPEMADKLKLINLLEFADITHLFSYRRREDSNE